MTDIPSGGHSGTQCVVSQTDEPPAGSCLFFVTINHLIIIKISLLIVALIFPPRIRVGFPG